MIGPAGWSASPWIGAIGWTLLHSLWQGGVVAMVLALVLGVLRRAPSPARYLAACAAMVVMVALPVWTLLRSIDPRPRTRVDEVAAAVPPAVATRAPMVLDPASIPGPDRPRIVDRIDSMLPAIVALWMAGVGGCSLRLLGGWIQACRWVWRHTRPLVDPWPDRVERLKERLGIRRDVALLESARIEVPMVVGWVRPAILVPVAALSGLGVPELEAILAHELAHIRRHDYLVNLIQCVVEVLMFYHPAAWWISGAIRRERETCCDDLAVAACRDRVTYARALAAMEGLRLPMFSVSTAASGGILLARVRRILEPQEESMNPVRILAGLAVVLAAAPLWLARGNSDQPPPAKSAEAESPQPNDRVVKIIGQVEVSPTGRLIVDTGGEIHVLGPGTLESLPDGRLMISLGKPAAGAPRSWGSEGARREVQAGKDLEKATATPLQKDAERQPGSEPVPIVDGSSDAEVKCLDPPGEAEVLARLPKKSKDDNPAAYKTQRDNVRILIEKIGDKVDPVMDYPLAGRCQLVHCHYKATVYYDELSWSDYPIPFQHVDHKVEVVYIDKDHLRRAPTSASRDRADDRTAKGPAAAGRSGKLPDAPISAIRFEGNATIPPEKLTPKLLSKVGQPFDHQKIDADVKSLMRNDLFSQVDTYQEESPRGSGQHALIFVVREMPVLIHVEFRGRKAIRLKEIEDTTQLKKGNRADPTRTRNAMHSILRLYQEKGYDLAEVELIEGGNAGDTRVVIQILEGPKVKITGIDFVGCQFLTPAMLRTRIASHPEIPGLPGRYHRDRLDGDRQKLLNYYQEQGFFEVQVTPRTREGANPGEIRLTFVIDEGRRYSVREAILQGNCKIPNEALMANLELHSGKPYLSAMRDADRRRILVKYSQIGCIDATVSVEPRFTGQPGVVDLLYGIEEGEPYLLGELEVAGNDRTMDKVIRREAIQTGLLPGEVLDGDRIDFYRRRLASLGYSDRVIEKPVEVKRERRDGPKPADGTPSPGIR